MKKIELLSPVGGYEQFIAAVESGADAVYLGGSSFNARNSATNFSDEELKEAIKYAIVNGKKGDIIMLIGKGHEDYKEIKGVKYPFDERVVIKEILNEIKG